MKKFLAFLLSLLMAGSMLSPGLPAFAQTTTETSTETQEEDTAARFRPPVSRTPRAKAPPAVATMRRGPKSWTSRQGTVPFIDESDPLMENLAVYMVELTTDTLIHSRNANERRYPASLTKIMTAILTLENIPDLDREITFTAELQNYVYEINLSYGGGISTGGIVLNETLTVEPAIVRHHAALGKRGRRHAGL